MAVFGNEFLDGQTVMVLVFCLSLSFASRLVAGWVGRSMTGHPPRPLSSSLIPHPSPLLYLHPLLCPRPRAAEMEWCGIDDSFPKGTKWHGGVNTVQQPQGNGQPPLQLDLLLHTNIQRAHVREAPHIVYIRSHL